MRNLTQEQKDEMRERLKKICLTKLNTTMIYPLSQFEMEFGHLWGHGKNEQILNDQEKINRQKWQRCRTNILNNGNQQKRGITSELDMHTVTWDRYQAILIPKEEYDGYDQGK